MPTRLARRGTPHDFKFLCSPIFKATVICTDLHWLVPHQTMPLVKFGHYGVALPFPRAPIQLVACKVTGEKGKGAKSTMGTFLL